MMQSRNYRPVPIKFVKNSNPYQAGEVAGFPEHIAKAYVDGGFAVFHEVSPTEDTPRRRRTQRPSEGGTGYVTKDVSQDDDD